MHTDQKRVEEAVRRLLLQVKQESGEDFESRESLPTPVCILDSESYDLLAGLTGSTGYPRIFAKAVGAIKTIVTTTQLDQAIHAVKRKRSGSRHKNVRTRIGKPEFRWLMKTATAMRTKPARVLEAVLFLYLRIEEEESAL